MRNLTDSAYCIVMTRPYRQLLARSDLWIISRSTPPRGPQVNFDLFQHKTILPCNYHPFWQSILALDSYDPRSNFCPTNWKHTNCAISLQFSYQMSDKPFVQKKVQDLMPWFEAKIRLLLKTTRWPFLLFLVQQGKKNLVDHFTIWSDACERGIKHQFYVRFLHVIYD